MTLTTENFLSALSTEFGGVPINYGRAFRGGHTTIKVTDVPKTKKILAERLRKALKACGARAQSGHWGKYYGDELSYFVHDGNYEWLAVINPVGSGSNAALEVEFSG